jgi:hypothetical protein
MIFATDSTEANPTEAASVDGDDEQTTAARNWTRRWFAGDPGLKQGGKDRQMPQRQDEMRRKLILLRQVISMMLQPAPHAHGRIVSPSHHSRLCFPCGRHHRDPANIGLSQRDC